MAKASKTKSSKAKAKTAAKSKGKAKTKSKATAKTGAARGAKEKIKPTYLPDALSIKIGLHDVIRALKMIEKHGRLDQFASAAKRSDAEVVIGATTVNLVKDLMVKYQLHDDPIGRHIVNANGATPEATATDVLAGLEGRDPFRPCNFGKRR